MDATIVKIDMSSIRKNPDYSLFPRRIPTTRHVIFVVLCTDIINTDDGIAPVLPEGFKANENYYVKNIETRDSTAYRFTCASIGEEIPNMIASGKRWEEIISIDCNTNFIEVEPDKREVLYDFMPTDLTCKFCGSVFDYTKLETKEFVDENMDEDIIQDICPVCGESDCCDYEFEKISVAVNLI